MRRGKGLMARYSSSVTLHVEEYVPSCYQDKKKKSFPVTLVIGTMTTSHTKISA